MSTEQLDNLERAYDLLADYDHQDIIAIAEKYLYARNTLDLREVQVMAAYIIINYSDY